MLSIGSSQQISTGADECTLADSLVLGLMTKKISLETSSQPHPPLRLWAYHCRTYNEIQRVHLRLLPPSCEMNTKLGF